MALRPARTCRNPKRQPWTRVSHKKPRKSFVKGVPHVRVRQWNMGTDKRFEVEACLVADTAVMVRDNALESSRMAANKHLEKKLEHNYFLRVNKYPHFIVREHSTLGVAGADRISKGMKKAFGRPKGRMARLHAGDAVFVVRLNEEDLRVLKEAFRRAKVKLSGGYRVVVRDIRNDPDNLKRPLEAEAIEEVVEEVPEEKPPEEVAEEEAAKPEEEKAEEEAKPGEEKEGEKKAEGKPEDKGKPSEKKGEEKQERKEGKKK